MDVETATLSPRGGRTLRRNCSAVVLSRNEPGLRDRWAPYIRCAVKILELKDNWGVRLAKDSAQAVVGLTGVGSDGGKTALQKMAGGGCVQRGQVPMASSLLAELPPVFFGSQHTWGCSC